MLPIETKPFPAKNQTLKILESLYFAYEAGIINSYSNRIFGCIWHRLFKNIHKTLIMPWRWLQVKLSQFL